MDNFLLLPRVFAAALFDLSFAATWGLLLVALWVPHEAALVHRLRRFAGAFTLGMLVALPMQCLLLAATMANSEDVRVIRAELEDVLTSTHAGRVLLLNIAVALFLFGLLLFYRSATRFACALRMSAVVLLAATRAAVGHAAADGDFTLAEMVQLIHLSSIATWGGGVIASGFVVIPQLIRDTKAAALQFVRRLSQIVTVALPLVVLTGIYNSYRGLDGALRPLTNTAWGGLLDLKIALVGIVLAMGWYNRRILSGHDALDQARTSRLSLVLRAEAIVMVLILGVSAWLANTAPPSSM